MESGSLCLQSEHPVPALTIAYTESVAMWLPRLCHEKLWAAENTCTWSCGMLWKKSSPEIVMLERPRLAFLI